MKLLKAFYEKDKDLLISILSPALNISKAIIKIDASNNLIFYTNKPVVATQDWVDMINDGCSGLIGSWTEAGKNKSKIWATCLINAAAHPTFVAVQKEFYMNNIKNSYFANANLQIVDKDTGEKVFVKPIEILAYNKENPELMDPYQKACIATFISYCANLPLYAIQNLYYTVGKHKDLTWQQKFNMFAKKCGIETTIKEWPIRWKHISPILADDFGIDISLEEPEIVIPKLDPLPKDLIEAPKQENPEPKIIVQDIVPEKTGMFAWVLNLINIILGMFKK